jgi:hypothetical protein
MKRIPAEVKLLEESLKEKIEMVTRGVSCKLVVLFS